MRTCQAKGIQLNSIGERLRTERNRLGLNQVDFGAIGGVQKQAQIKYERDERSPDAMYLSAVAAAGVDVAYVLTGQRSNVDTSQHLLPEEKLIIEAYRTGSPETQDFLLRAALGYGRTISDSAVQSTQVAKKAQSHKKEMIFQGDVGQVSKGNMTNQGPITFTMREKKKDEG